MSLNSVKVNIEPENIGESVLKNYLQLSFRNLQYSCFLMVCVWSNLTFWHVQTQKIAYFCHANTFRNIFSSKLLQNYI